MLYIYNNFCIFAALNFMGMETLFYKHNLLLKNTSTKIIRQIMSQINWSARLISIQGARGVGKSTLLKQFVKQNFSKGDRAVLYCSLDSIYFSSNNILDLADKFVINGGQWLFLDEVHKYPTWSKEIKEIYDLYPELHVVFSGSSILNILNGDADLSRRCVTYKMQGLSFREYLQFNHNLTFPAYTLEDCLNNADEICADITEKCKIVPLFKDYLQFGYYPYYLENKKDYYTRIEQTVNLITEVELPQLCNVSVANIRKIKALISVLSSSLPYELDATKLAKMIEIHRNTVIEYLYDLERAKVFNLLFSNLINVKKLQKPDKIYLENTNLLYALSNVIPQIGTVRETFAVNQLMKDHQIEYCTKNGDFKIDRHWVFEVGGRDKNFNQIAKIEDSFILADDIEMPIGHKLPLWLVGFTY